MFAIHKAVFFKKNGLYYASFVDFALCVCVGELNDALGLASAALCDYLKRTGGVKSPIADVPNGSFESYVVCRTHG